jgi:hypothetical protein
LGAGKETLFCHGIPGSGKTVLTAIVIEKLAADFGNDKSIGLAYIYCKFESKDHQTFEDLLASLLKQLTRGLLTSGSAMPDCVKSLYGQHEQRGTRPGWNELSDCLQAVSTLYSRVFVVVDALDECDPSDNCRRRFISALFDLQAKSTANVFATSRPLPDIQDQFHHTPSVKIQAAKDDVKKYIRSRMKHMPELQAIFAGEARRKEGNPYFQPLEAEHITICISNAVQGMYVLILQSPFVISKTRRRVLTHIDFLF